MMYTKGFNNMANSALHTPLAPQSVLIGKKRRAENSCVEKRREAGNNLTLEGRHIR
jgi:hypothetical protein